VNAEFNWWLLLVGLVIGAGLAWVVLDDRDRGRASSLIERDEEDVAAESSWISAQLAHRGAAVDADVAEVVLRLHAEYLDSDGWTPDQDREATIEENRMPAQLEAPPNDRNIARTAENASRPEESGERLTRT
jgi:hypothetical protein